MHICWQCKLYAVVVHYLQMCMNEYGCCPKFKRGDNSIYTFMKGVALTRYTTPLFVKA
jgi:hypothetical protein